MRWGFLLPLDFAPFSLTWYVRLSVCRLPLIHSNILLSTNTNSTWFFAFIFLLKKFPSIFIYLHREILSFLKLQLMKLTLVSHPNLDFHVLFFFYRNYPWQKLEISNCYVFYTPCCSHTVSRLLYKSAYNSWSITIA